MDDATLTFQVDAGLKDQFLNAAKSRDRTGDQLLRDFMRDFVRLQQGAAELDDWFQRQVKTGLDSAKAGHLISAAEVEAEFSAKREATRLRMASTGSNAARQWPSGPLDQ